MNIPIEIILFALTLVGVALFHKHTLKVALTGLTTVTVYKLGFSDFHGVSGGVGLLHHIKHESSILLNLGGLLLGFEILSTHFKDTRIPDLLPKFLPDDWKGPFALLVIDFVLSSFLDNIAAAMISGTVAATVFRKKVHVGYLAALVAASNAGGSGSVIGDTTTTMMWIDGVNPFDILHAYAAAIPALFVFGFIASHQQDRYQRILKDPIKEVTIDYARLGVVGVILAFAIGANAIVNSLFADYADSLPWVGGAVWLAILLTQFWRKPHWESIPHAVKGTLFLLSLVLTASMMPVEKLPEASWQTAFGLGFLSSVFDNIPLTKLALTQGGYDWGVLAYAVGFGGSMMWFGSSAGVAITNEFPEGKSVVQWLRHGWHVPLGYVVGYAILLGVWGWHPHTPHRGAKDTTQHTAKVSGDSSNSE